MLINHMKTLPFVCQFPLPKFVKKDIERWSVFLPTYNRVLMMAVEDWSDPD